MLYVHEFRMAIDGFFVACEHLKDWPNPLRLDSQSPDRTTTRHLRPEIA